MKNMQKIFYHKRKIDEARYYIFKNGAKISVEINVIYHLTQQYQNINSKEMLCCFMRNMYTTILTLYCGILKFCIFKIFIDEAVPWFRMLRIKNSGETV